MKNILNGLYNLLTFIEANWGMIVAIIIMATSIYKRATDFISKSKEEKLEIAKAQISETMLKWVSLAECDWKEWSQAGEIKRSQVIDLIFEKYPILSTVADQEEIVAWLDNTIDEALKTMRRIFEENAERGSIDEITEMVDEVETLMEARV